MNILFAVLTVIIGIILVLAEHKIFKKIEVHMEKKGATNYKSHFSGYIILGTIGIFILLALWFLRS